MKYRITNCGAKLHEECGVFGIAVADDEKFSAAGETYNALYALQHRGQQSCGIASSNGKKILFHRDSGLVPEVFNEKNLADLEGNIAIGHVRYATKKWAHRVNAQPVILNHVYGNFAVAYNGNIINGRELRNDIERKGGVFHTANDAEIMSYLIVRERMSCDTLEDAVKAAMQQMKGAYSLLVMSQRKLIAARDPNGFRPLCMGRMGKTVVFASESCAFDAIGAEFVRDVNPGEIIVVEDGRIKSLDCGMKGKESLCVFEFVYFARPDSVIDGVSVDIARINAGKCLARNNKNEADIVIGVPDSGLSAALGFAQESGIPYAVGLIKNRYIGRTFIQPSQDQRQRAVKIKLNALSAIVKDKRVIMVDDSIVRGTTCARIINLLRDAGAREVHMRISSPPFLYPCFFGTDVPDSSKLIAHNRTVEEVRQIIGADSLDYLKIEDIPKTVEGLNIGFCQSCFTGEYAVDVPKTLEETELEGGAADNER
ncbi:MAG: amidophosphoribosyltransferase [Clostridia bacterium]|nr:amidophosphoribosyltransferase [Clostridia bacterium]